MKETAVFGGGCFWCTEAVFKMLKGVESVLPGYAGGSKETARYWRVVEGDTGHVEVVEVQFDPSVVPYRDLLTVFFGSHDPTSIDRQGPDIGPMYRSVIFYTTEAQKKEAEEFIKEINESSMEGKSVATTIEPLKGFYVAEDYHKDYYENNPDSRYCELVVNPKLERVKLKFAGLLSDASRHT